MQQYNRLSDIYDALMGAGCANIYTNIISKYFPGQKGLKILDFGSGTGTLLYKLSQKHSTFGVDSSRKMVGIAKQKDPRSSYYVGDIRTVRVREQFDVVVCAFDTINHLSTFSDWKQVFQNAAKHLKNDGLFIFDFNTLEKLNELDGKTLIRYLDLDVFILHTKKTSKNRSLWHINIFSSTKKENIYKRHSENIIETSFDQERIKSALKKHFSVLKELEKNGRIFLVNKKVDV